MADQTEREALREALDSWDGDHLVTVEAGERLLNHLISLGVTRQSPRVATVETVEQLEALNSGTAFVDRMGDAGVWQAGSVYYPQTATVDAERCIKKYSPLTVLTPATQPTASEPVRIPYEFTEAQVDQAFRNFIDSFNGDEAGDVEHVRDLAGNSGFAATGGNDMRAVFEKARAALTAAAKEGENRWTVVSDGDDLRITHSDFPGWYWHRSKVLDGPPWLLRLIRSLSNLP